MRIALVVENFSRSGGGVEYAVWQLAQAFCELGDDVHVVARAGEEQAGVTLHRVSVPTFWQPWRVLAFSRAAGEVVRQQDFDVVHAFSPTRSQDILHAGGGSHAAYMEHAYGGWGRLIRILSPRHRVRLHMERHVLRGTRQRVQCVSEQGAREFSRYYSPDPHRLFVVPYGVDAQHFSPDAESGKRRSMREEWGGADGTVWLFPGSGFRRKGLATALSALSLCEDQTARLWVVGRDKTRRWRRRARALGVEDRVFFLGFREDMPALYQASDGMILPTRYDAWGLVCLEASASGRPVITSAQCGASESLGSMARVVDRADDVRGFAEALDHFSDAGQRARAGEEGRLVAEGLSWSDCAASLREAYAQVDHAHQEGSTRAG